MTGLAFHPNAYLSEKRNVRRGLVARTKILRALEEEGATARVLAKEATLNYKVVLHHLRLLQAERIATHKTSKKPYSWELTGAGQQRLKPV